MSLGPRLFPPEHQVRFRCVSDTHCTLRHTAAESPKSANVLRKRFHVRIAVVDAAHRERFAVRVSSNANAGVF